ncbi:hypothetical protein ACFXPS_13275 [Nocardia sp. NPDC059091]|uniref:hypothetical protein n=1 Tax=Nocardia sp. NPDC059091 TaxID=3346724 RepID=UPI0036792371
MAESGKISAGSGAQFIVGGEPVLLAALGIDAHDVRGIGRQSDYSKFTHRYLLFAAQLTAIARLATPPTFWNSSALLRIMGQDTRRGNLFPDFRAALV